MTRFLLAGAAALSLMSGAAMAQSGTSSSTSETATTTVPAAPVTVQSMTTRGNAIQSDGDRTATAGTGSKDSAGNASTTVITNQTYPLTNMITTTKKTDQTVNGVTTETVTTTQTYPHVVGRPDVPPVTSTTTHVVTGSN